MHRRSLLAAAAAPLLGTGAAWAQASGEPVKVAFLTTLSGPGAALGVQMRDGWALAMKHLDGKLGGVPAETLVLDDEMKPEVAVSKARAAVERDKVLAVAGLVFSNILAAVLRPVTEGGAFLLSANAGPSTLAGRGCNKDFFATSYQNDQIHAAMGQVAQDEGFKRVMVLVPNYQAGKDAVSGFRSRFRGEVLDELYVPLNQLDFSGELARIAAARPDALFTFMPGGLGVNLVRQYRQAGLAAIPFLSTFTVDEATLPAQGEAALGFFTTGTWGPDVATEGSRRFVRDFEAAYGYVPATYAAHGYDAAMLLDAGLRRADGRAANRAAIRAGMEKPDFTSLRGAFTMGANHFPIQDISLFKVGRRPDGKFATEWVRKVLSNDVDPYAADCRLR